MSMKWEFELKEPVEDDESEDVLQSEDDEEDYLDCCQCISDPCLSDWLSPAF